MPVESLLTPKFIYLILGFVFLLAAVAATCAGKTIARYKGWIYRDKDRGDFWGVVAIYFIGGVICLGVYLGSIFPEVFFHPEQWLHLK